jgi:hypothetical protein
LRASVTHLPDYHLVELADRLRREYVGAVASHRVLEVVMEASRGLRSSALSRAMLVDLLEQAARRALVHEIARATLDLEPAAAGEPRGSEGSGEDLVAV